MADDRQLRELEREWKRTGSADDEAAYLSERVRLGHLAPERLSFAARCGHDAARRALSGSAPLGPRDWLRQLEEAPIEARVLTVVGITEAVLVLGESLTRPEIESVEGVLRSLRSWADRPCHEALERVRESLDSLPFPGTRRRRRDEARFLTHLAYLVALGGFGETSRDDWPFATRLVEDLERSCALMSLSDHDLARIRARVAEWALNGRPALPADEQR